VTTSTPVALPVIPALPSALVAQWITAHNANADALAEMPSSLAAHVQEWQSEHAMEGLSGIAASVSGAVDLPLFPSRRAFLSDHDRARLAGCRAGLDHVEVRITLTREHRVDRLLEPETPFVLHALVEGPDTTGDVSNPGLLRVNDTRFAMRQSTYSLPDPDAARQLLAAFTARLAEEGNEREGTEREGTDLAVAAWAIFTFLAIHPFVDGNGRTARLLYLLLASRRLRAPDLGALEMLTLDRQGYIAALADAYNVTEHWDPAALDATAFTRLVATWSLRGADVYRQRIVSAGAAGSVADQVHAGLTRDDVGWIVRLWMDGSWIGRNGAAFDHLADRGLVERFPAPPSRSIGNRTALAYRLIPALRDTLDAGVIEHVAASA